MRRDVPATLGIAPADATALPHSAKGLEGGGDSLHSNQLVLHVATVPPKPGPRAPVPSCVEPLWGAPCHATAILAKGAEGFVAPHAALNVMQLLTESSESSRDRHSSSSTGFLEPQVTTSRQRPRESRDRLSVVSNGNKRIAAGGDPEANGSSWQCPAACERDATDSELLGCHLRGNSPQLRSHAP